MSKTIVLMITIWGLGLVLAVVGLWLAFSIPQAAIAGNVRPSLTQFKTEGTYPSYGWYPRQIVLDNYTDSIMVNTAYSVPNHSLSAILLDERQIISTSEVDQIKNLQAAVDGTAPMRVSYERYWHGYLTWLRPLLAVMPYQQIRILLYAVQLVLFGTLLWQLYRKRGLIYTVALLVAAVAVDFFFVGQSMQFVQVFLLGMIGALVMLKLDKLDIKVLYFVMGMTTMFFDFLSAPLVSLGFLLITDNNRSIKTMLARAGWWSLGYIVFSWTKWVMTQLVLGRGVITDALSHVVDRTVHQADASFSYLKVLQLNVAQLIGYARLSQLIVGGIGLLLLVGWLRFRNKRVRRKQLGYWLTVMVLPYIWYLVAANHSYLHVWYTYRAQFISVFAGIMVYGELVNVRTRGST